MANRKRLGVLHAAAQAFKFEQLVGRLLAAAGYTVDPVWTESKHDRDPGLDFVANFEGVRVAVEAKLYRSPRTPNSILYNAAATLQRSMQSADCRRAILAVTSYVDGPTKRQFQNQQIDVWGLDELKQIASQHSELSADFSSFLRDAEIGAAGIRPDDSIQSLTVDVPTSAPSQGAAIIAELKSIKAGKKQAQDFEQRCEQALRYLFGDQFGVWMPQKKVARGFHRMDLLARLVPNHNFWLSIAQDFTTRYIVFEFKNYRERVSQNQIYTTEKYLYPNALRSVAIHYCTQRL